MPPGAHPRIRAPRVLSHMHPTSTSARGNGAQPTDLQSTLRRIEARLARLEQTLEPIAELSAHAPALIATAGDIIDETALELGDVDERVRGAIDVLERLTRPKTLEHLRKLVDIVEDAPNVVATGVDIVDELMDEAAQEGIVSPHHPGVSNAFFRRHTAAHPVSSQSQQ